tara:strand:+ start:5417 stop:6070 length:654 start_codon:yes stop_codon:yes gene_type:complete
MGVMGNLWVNPFLDEFYDWGRGVWWNSKEEFLDILDTPSTLKAGRFSKAMGGTRYDDEFPQEIVKYLVERVPEWYFNGLPKDSSGLPLLIMKHMDIGAFSESISSSTSTRFSNFLSAWENNTPFPVNKVNFYPEGPHWRRTDRVWEESYKDYPEELKSDGCMLLCHEYYKSYVRLVDLQGVFWNALLFTAEKNKSWCETSKISFLNWTLRNPMEVKE